MCTLPQININQTKTRSSFNMHLSGQKQPTNPLGKRPCPGRDRAEMSSKARLRSYKSYLIKRVEDAVPEFVPTKQLLQEITDRGYRGSFNAFDKFLRTVRKQANIRNKASLCFHKEYIIKRVEDAVSEFVPTKQLFQEITDRGYRRSFSTFEKFLCTVRKKAKIPNKASLCFHKEYIMKRFEDAVPEFVPTKQLFQEITDRGYQRSFNTFQKFLCTVRKKAKMTSKTSLRFHKEYLIKRVEDAVPEFVPTKQLLKEIRAQGYREGIRTLEKFLCTVREKKGTQKKPLLCFYKQYLIQRVKDAIPEFVPTKRLFEEIIAKGYRGSIKTLGGFLCKVRKKAKMTSKAFLSFHKEYLTKRIRDALPAFVPTKQLFKEITDQGYRGKLQSLSKFLFTQHKKEQPKISLDFYKDYVTQKVEQAWPERVSSEQLFEEIRAKGYRGEIRVVEGFLAKMYKSMSSETFLQFHKEYILKRVNETWPDYLSTKQIFEEITARGYRGSLRTLQKFLSTNRKKSKTSLGFHKDYLMQKVEGALPDLPINQLFQEITDRGYRGSLKTLQQFLSEIPKNKELSKEALLQSHKDYLIQKVAKLAPNCVSAKQLFKEMTARGYRGTYKEIEVFLMMISK